MYHAKCLATLYKSASKVNGEDQSISGNDKILHGLALAELVSYIISKSQDYNESKPTVFKLADLVKIYSTSLTRLGVENTQIHSTDLKKRILAQIPDLQAHKEGRDALLAFDKDIACALQQATKTLSSDDDAIILSKAAEIIRRDINNHKLTEFDGTFGENCQQKSLPPSLLTTMSMITTGSSYPYTACDAQSALSCSQLLYFDSTGNYHSSKAKSMYHARDKEPPLPIYVGLLSHVQTRKRTLIDKLYNLGLSISYDRVLSISTDVGNAVSALFEEERLVRPPNLCKDLFTTAGVDNLDHDPSSTTSQDSFHGTGISLFQHVGNSAGGTPRNTTRITGNPKKERSLSHNFQMATLLSNQKP